MISLSTNDHVARRVKVALAAVWLLPLMMQITPPLTAAAHTLPVCPAAVDEYGDPLPVGAVGRLGTVRLRHGNTIHSLCFAPDGKYLASGGENIRVWDPNTGAERHRFNGHEGVISSPFGTGPKLIGKESVISSLAFGTDSGMLVSGGWDGTVCVWDVRAGKCTRHLRAHSGRVQTLAFSPKAGVAASAGWYGEICLWDVKTGRLVWQVHLDGHSLNALGFSPDGRMLASGGSNAIVYIWDVESGREVRRLTSKFGLVYSLSFSPDGKMLAAAGRMGGIQLWDRETWRGMRQFAERKGRITTIAFSPDSKSLVSGDVEGEVCLWEVPTGKELRKFHGLHSNVQAVAYSPDGKTVAAGGSDHSIRLWRTETGEAHVIGGGHEAEVTSLAFSADGQKLVTGSRDHSVRLWDVPARKSLTRLETSSGEISSVALGQTPLVVAGNYEGTVDFWDGSSSKQLRQLRDAYLSVWSVAVSKNGKLLAYTDVNGKIYARHLNGPDSKLPFWSGGRGRLVVISPNDVLLASDAAPYTIELRSVANLTDARRLEIQKDRTGEMQIDPHRLFLAFSADARHLVWASENLEETLDKPAGIWDLNDGRELRRFGRPDDRPQSVAISPDGKTMAVGYRDDTVKLWEVSSGGLRQQALGHAGAVKALAFAPRGDLLASASSDTTVLLWSLPRLRSSKTERLVGPAKPIDQLWADLGSADAARAYGAIGTLVSVPRDTVPWLAAKLSAIQVPDSQYVAQLVRKLDDNDFETRQRARAELEGIAELVVADLRKTLNKSASAEVRRQLKQILEKVERHQWMGENLRQLRALEVLESIGTEPARRVLERLVGGSGASRVTQEAKACLKRLGTGTCGQP